MQERFVKLQLRDAVAMYYTWRGLREALPRASWEQVTNSKISRLMCTRSLMIINTDIFYVKVLRDTDSSYVACESLELFCLLFRPSFKLHRKPPAKGMLFATPLQVTPLLMIVSDIHIDCFVKRGRSTTPPPPRYRL